MIPIKIAFEYFCPSISCHLLISGACALGARRNPPPFSVLPSFTGFDFRGTLLPEQPTAFTIHFL